MDIEKHFNTLLQETERRMAAAAAGMEGKETVATCREMVSYLKAKNRELKAYALARPFSGDEEEIRYFKYYKPALTGRLLYYYRVYQIESGCPGCLRVAETYYRRAMERAERMMERYLPFYQYYHSGATYRDDYYFLRAKGELSPESGSFVLDENRRVLLKAGKPIELTQVEFQIMELFFHNPGIALVREKILKGVWGENYFGDVKIVDVNIRRLRMKIEDEPSSPQHILTVWGYGYRWNA